MLLEPHGPPHLAVESQPVPSWFKDLLAAALNQAQECMPPDHHSPFFLYRRKKRVQRSLIRGSLFFAAYFPGPQELERNLASAVEGIRKSRPGSFQKERFEDPCFFFFF